MKIEVICSGTELLRGNCLDTNLKALGAQLNAAGCPLERARVIADDRAELIAALHQAALDCDVVIVVGGLGSTGDDLTRQITAEFFGLPLLRSDAHAAALRRYYRRRHGAGPIPRALFRQADYPEGSILLENPNGSAPGLFLEPSYGGRRVRVFLLPGPPAEFEPMVAAEVTPRLQAWQETPRRTQGFLAVGIGELELEMRIAGLPELAGVEVATCTNPEGTRLFLAADAAASLDAALAACRTAIGEAALEAGRLSLAAEVIRLAGERQTTLGLAESCTGGLIAAQLTDIPGASTVFSGGVVSYANAVKNHLLNVPQAVLDTHGAVSRECAEAMARGALRQLGVGLAGAVTGIAGPDGGTAEKPVGLVHFAVTAADGRLLHQECRFRGSREQIRLRSAATLLQLLRRMLLEG